MTDPLRLFFGSEGPSFLEWKNDAAALHFAHATGFNALTYRGLLQPLGNRFHLVASDARGHGKTSLPHARADRWLVFRDDLTKTLESLTPTGAILAGHSMGATVSLMVAARRPDLVHALVLIEPVFVPRSLWWRAMLTRLGLRPGEPGLAERALKRRDEFPSREAALAAYRGRGAFKTWKDETIVDYLKGGTVRHGQGYRLSCSPAWESECFRSAPFGVSRLAAWVRCPLTIIHGEHGSTSSHGELAIIKRLNPSARIASQKGASHFLPMEFPELVRDEITRIAHPAV